MVTACFCPRKGNHRLMQGCFFTGKAIITRCRLIFTLVRVIIRRCSRAFSLRSIGHRVMPDITTAVDANYLLLIAYSVHGVYEMRCKYIVFFIFSHTQIAFCFVWQ
jgi:hypothetical protein